MCHCHQKIHYLPKILTIQENLTVAMEGKPSYIHTQKYHQKKLIPAMKYFDILLIYFLHISSFPLKVNFLNEKLSVFGIYLILKNPLSPFLTACQ